MIGAAVRFPQAYAAFGTDLLVDVYARGPERVWRALNGLTEETLGARPLPGKWTVLEIAIHLADSELIGAARIRLVLAADEPRLPGYDQDRWARDLRYASSDSARLASSLDLFAALRLATLPLLIGAAPGDWSRTGTHPDHGPVTLRNLLELYADHSERHIAQILSRRELLSVPVALPLLLPERLY